MRHTFFASVTLMLFALPAYAAMAASTASTVLLGEKITTQLPRSVLPGHYAVAITPDLKSARFSARVAIDLVVLEITSSITLNAADLEFSNIDLQPVRAGAKPVARTVAIDKAKQTATFTFADPLAPGSYRLVLDYTGTIGSQPVGLFSLDYDNAGERKRALYTQFENSDARRMIPSWDEPAYKTTFSLEATVPAGELAVSNMPVKSRTTLADGRVLVKFMSTPKMSTYLLFFGLGEFDRASAMVDGTELGVITQKGALSKARFALDSSTAILREYNDYFGVRFPLPKLDNIAAPGRSQFFGAMENWGAIFTFEHAMLLDPSISTQNDKERAFAIAAHEMAHQWFGDLVTMQWWDDLWLNEGFASWMESRTTARLHPEWDTALNAVSVRERAMNRDSLATTHPVVQHVETVEQASQAFDSITYQKGEAVIRMLENYVGTDAWRSGVRAYMKAHAYSNTKSDDLWRAIEKSAGKPITAVAHDFTLQPGVPMIRLASVACKAGKSLIVLSQSEFSRDQPNKKPLRWRVPVVMQIGVGQKPVTALVSSGKTSVTVAGCGPVLINAGQAGYYRTAYAPAAFKALAAGFDKMATIDQLGLLSDSWALGLNGMQPIADFMDLANTAPLSAAPQVWNNIATTFDAIQQYYRVDTVRQQRFATYAIGRLAPEFAQVGWVARPGEAETVPPLREHLIGVLSVLGDPATIAEARRRYAAAVADPTAVPPALRKIIMTVVAEHADTTSWDSLRKMAQAEPSAMIKNDLYDLLAAAKDPVLAQRALALALTDEPGVTNSAAMLSRVAAEHPDAAFDFALANIARVNERVDPTSRSRYFPGLANTSAAPGMIVKVNAYATANLDQGSRREADTTVARIRDRIRIRTERLPEIDVWLNK